MAEQETLIYIDENDVLDASVSARNFTTPDTQNRVYYNTLGAKLVKKFLTSEDIDVSNIYNIHSIQKVLENLDISDIMLKNIHIDVRVVFNENYIFIPKSHFAYDILPDVYLVLLMSNDKKYMKFMGFFEPKMINKNNQNEDYYFIEKEKLTPPASLKEYINNFKGNTDCELSASEIDTSDMLILSLVDHDISEQEQKQLLKNLVKSAQLRDRFIEFENFELLAYKAQSSPEVIKPELEQELELKTSKNNTFDAAAAATAAALEELDSLGMAASITSTTASSTAMSAEVQQNEFSFDAIEGLTEVLGNDEDIINGFNDLQRNLPDFTPEKSEEQQTVTNSSTTDFSEIEGLDFNELSLENTDSLKENSFIPKTSAEPEVFNASENITMDFGEIKTPAEKQSHADLTSLDTESETVSFDEFEMNTELSSAKLEEPIADTISFDQIEPALTDEHKEPELETNAEIMDFEEISSAEEKPANLEVEAEIPVDFEQIDNTIQEETSEIQTQELKDEMPLELENIEDLSLDMPEEELSFDENLSLDNEPANEIEKPAGMEQPQEPEFAEEQTEPTLDSIENLMAEDETNPTSEALPEAEIPDEDKELEKMLSSEEFTTAVTEKTTTDADSIAEMNLDANDVEESVNTDSLTEAELFANDNETEIAATDLISQIDDLLGSEEESVENNSETTKNNDDDDKLEMLFNSAESGSYDNRLETFDDSGFADEDGLISPQIVTAPEKGKKAVMIAAAAIVTIAVAAAGAGLFLKGKNSDMLAQNPIENDTTNLPMADNQLPAGENTDSTNLMTNNPVANKTTENQLPPAPVPTSPAPTKPAPAAQKPAAAKPAAKTQTPPKTSPAGTAMPYVTVRSLTWEVPDYLSYSDKIKKYLQTAGKSIKLSLSSDLLLATEYAYSNQVKVELKLKNDGTIENIQITKSSGSNQINDIVLRTVKQTLNVVKPAPGEVPTANFKLGLIINL